MLPPTLPLKQLIPLQVVSSGHPWVVVSTAHVEDCDESSSFLMEWLLQALARSRMALMSAEKGVSVGATPDRTVRQHLSKKDLFPDAAWQGLLRF